MKKELLFELIDAATEIVKDSVLKRYLQKVEEEKRNYLLENASQNREKQKSLIKTMEEIEFIKKRLEIEFECNKNRYSESDQAEMKKILDKMSTILERQSQECLHEKRALSHH